jgi:hypothetical protein
MFAPIVPGVAAWKLLVDVRNSCCLKIVVETAVRVNERIFHAAIEPKWRQMSSISLEAGSDVEGIVVIKGKGLGIFEEKRVQIRGVGHAAVSRQGGKVVSEEGTETQCAVASHGEAAEETGRTHDAGFEL